MRCPDLGELPPPPEGRTGWPWTIGSPAVSGPLPTISIVTPSYQQGAFLEETIRSVLLQGYPGIEYIVMDGGSTDGSAEIIRKYRDFLAHSDTGPDKGQADAVARGFDRAHGDLIAWINSDDLYLPGAFTAVGSIYRESRFTWSIGNGTYIREDGSRILDNVAYRVTYRNLVHVGMKFLQPTMFMERASYITAGGIDPAFAFCLDYDLAVRLARIAPPVRVRVPIAAARMHAGAKTARLKEVRHREDGVIQARYGRRAGSPYHMFLTLWDGSGILFHKLWTSGPAAFIKWRITYC